MTYTHISLSIANLSFTPASVLVWSVWWMLFTHVSVFLFVSVLPVVCCWPAPCISQCCWFAPCISVSVYHCCILLPLSVYQCCWFAPCITINISLSLVVSPCLAAFAVVFMCLSACVFLQHRDSREHAPLLTDVGPTNAPWQCILAAHLPG